jgi:UDP-glucose 4-epimerase
MKLRRSTEYWRYKVKNCIVTGAAGFIGSHICDELIKRGHNVVAIDNMLSGKMENINHLLNNERFEFVEVDVLDTGQYKDHVKTADIIFHEAASKKTISLNDPCRDIDINVKGTFKLLDLARKTGKPGLKFIHASTGSVYGDVDGIITTKTLTRPTSVYGVDKLAGERFVRLFGKQYGMKSYVLRYFHVYGPRQDDSDQGGVVAIFIKKLLHNEPIIINGDGMQTRLFTYVDDVVERNMRGVDVPGWSFDVENVASTVQTNLLQLIYKLSKIIGRDGVEIIYHGETEGDIREFKIEECSFFTYTELDEGLRETVEFYKEKYNID